MESKILLLLVLVGTALAGPIVPQGQYASDSQCRRPCLPNNFQKLYYQRGKTYEYELEAESLVKMNTINSQEVKMRWSAGVELFYESPCEVTLKIKNPRLDGQENPSFAREITQYPLRAVVIDGVFEQVCVNPQDTFNAVNLKKGVLSTLQNSLPSNSTMHDGIQLHETDVNGICPTTYRVKQEGSKILVEKTKDHRLCTERYSYPSKSPESAMFLKSPLPMRKSESKCTQEIEQGLIKSSACTDENEIIPIMGIKKSTVTKQTSSLRLKTVTISSSVPQLSEIRKSNLLFDFAIPPRNTSAIPDLERKLREINHSLEQKLKPNLIAQKFSDLIQIMNQVPEESIKESLNKITSGQFGSQKESLQELYLDAVSVTLNNGAISVMVDKILSKQRLFEYTSSLFTFPRTCRHAVREVKRLFEAEDVPLSTVLAAGSVVGTYCRTEAADKFKVCEQVPEVREVMQSISSKLSRSCQASQGNARQTKKTIALLKAVGNIRRMDDQLKTVVMSCLEQQRTPQSVRAAAADALKTIPCRHDVTKKLMEMAMHQNEHPVQRMLSYKAGIECANASDISRLLTVVQGNTDEQVRSYILSDLSKLQQSKSPQKLIIRQKLAPFDIPQVYSNYPWNSSLSYEYSEFTESKSFGTELGLDLIYEAANMLPKEIRTNFTLDMFKEISSVAEMGVRFENLPEILKKMVREGSLIGQTTLGAKMRGILNSLPSSSSNGQLDYFLKLFGKEVLFASYNTAENYEKDILQEIFDLLGKVYVKILTGANIERVKGYQLRYDLHVPTMQGAPLVISTDTALVGSLYATPSQQRNARSPLEVTPVLSAVSNLFVGYKFGPTVGLKMWNNFSSTSDIKVLLNYDNQDGFSAKVELPQNNAELLLVKSETSLIKQLPGLPQLKIPHSRNDPRVTGRQCKSSSTIGLQVCYEYDLPEILQSQDFPLVRPMNVKITVTKSSPSVRSHELHIKRSQAEKDLEVKFLVPGTSNPEKLVVDLRYDIHTQPKQFAVVTKFPQNTYGMKIIKTLRNSESSKDCKLEWFTGLRTLQDQGEKVLVSEVIVNKEERRGSWRLQTLGSLQRSLTADVDIRGSLPEGYPYWPLLEKFEVKLITEEYRSENFIRKTASAADASQYTAQFSLKHQERLVAALKSSTSYRQLQQGSELQARVALERPQQVWEATVDFKKVPHDNHIYVQVTKGQDNVLVKLVGECKKQQQTLKSLVSLEIPSYEVKWKVASKIEERQQGRKELDLTIQDQDSTVVAIRGPLTYFWTEQDKKIDAELGIRNLKSGGNYFVETQFESSPMKKQAKLVIKNENEAVLEYMHEYSVHDTTRTLISKIKQQDNWNTEIHFVDTNSRLEASGDIKIPRISAQHLRANTTIVKGRYNDMHHFSSKMQWDLERNPEKQIALSGSLNLAEENELSIEGEVQIMREKYPYHVTSFFKRSSDWSNIEKDLIIQIHKESSEYFSLRSIQKIVIQSKHKYTVNSDVHMRTPSGEDYSLTKHTVNDFSSELPTFKTECTITSSSTGKLHKIISLTIPQRNSFLVKGAVQSTPPQQSQPSLDMSYEAEVQLDSDRQFSEAKVQVIIKDSAQEMLRLDASGNVRNKEASITVKKNQALKFQMTAKVPQPRSITIEMRTPSATSEIIGQYTQQEKSLTLIPNIQQRSQKYSMQYKNQPDESKTLFIEFHHNGRQKHIEGEWKGSEGKLEFDVMSQQGRKITITARKTRIGAGVSKTEVTIATSSGSQGPVVVVESVLTPTEKVVTTFYKKDAASPPSMVLSSKYIKQSSKDAVISVIFSGVGQKLELGGTLTKEMTYGCQGYKLNSTAMMQGSSPYLLQIQLCKPGFMKVISGVKDSSERYVAKLGLESYLHAELSAMKNARKETTKSWKDLTGAQDEHAEYPLLAVSSKLISPVTLGVRLQLSKANIEEAKQVLSDRFSNAVDELKPVLQRIADKIKQDLREKIPEISEAIEKLQEWIDSIWELEAVQQALEFVQEEIEKVKRMITSVSNVTAKLVRKLESFRAFAARNTMSLRQKMRSMMSETLQMVQERLDTMTSSVLSQNILQKIIEKLKEIIDKFIDNNFSNDRTRQELKTVLEEYVTQLVKDGELTLELLLEDKSAQYARSYLRRHVDMYSKQEYLKLLQAVIVRYSPQNVGIVTERSSIEINLPLWLPVGSVLSAPRYVGFQSRPLGPYQAHSSGNERIATFSEKWLQLPPSKCEYVFTTHPSDATLTIANLRKPEYTQRFKYLGHVVKVLVGQKTTYIDGVEQPRDQSYSMQLDKNLVVSYNVDGMLTVTSTVLRWKVDLNRQSSVIQSYVRASGIGWDKFTGKESPAELLQKFEPHKVDKNCLP